MLGNIAVYSFYKINMIDEEENVGWKRRGVIIEIALGGGAQGGFHRSD